MEDRIFLRGKLGKGGPSVITDVGGALGTKELRTRSNMDALGTKSCELGPSPANDRTRRATPRRSGTTAQRSQRLVSRAWRRERCRREGEIRRVSTRLTAPESIFTISTGFCSQSSDVRRWRSGDEETFVLALEEGSVVHHGRREGPERQRRARARGRYRSRCSTLVRGPGSELMRA